MKVYFMASITGRPKYDSNYRLVVRALEKNGCIVTSKHIFDTTREYLLNQSQKERVRDHNKLQTMMKKADLVVTEVSYPSTSVGYEIARALEWNKSLLVLHLEGTDSPTILRGRVSDKFILETYTLYNLESVVKASLDYFQKIGDTRFTLLLPEKIMRYLDWISNHRNKPRSVFIREALLEKLSNDQAFLKNEEGPKKPSVLTSRMKAKQ